MSAPPEPASRALRGLALLLLYGAVSWWVLGLFLSAPGINGYAPASFAGMVDGTAHRPYVGRALVPGVVRRVTEATPQAWREAAAGRAQRALGGPQLRAWKWQRERLWQFLVASALFWAAFVGWAFALRGGIGLFYEAPPLARDVAPALALCGLPLFFINQNHIYDPATLLLFTLGALLVAVRSRWYLPLFALSCLNKETSILLVPLFWARHRLASAETGARVHAASLLAMLGAQLGIWTLARGVVALAFGGNPGGATEFHLAHNWAMFGNSQRLLPFACVVLGAAGVSVHGWRRKPPFLRAALLLTALPLLGLALFPGIIVLDELRAYYEAYPFVVLLAVPSVRSLLMGDLAWGFKELP